MTLTNWPGVNYIDDSIHTICHMYDANLPCYKLITRVIIFIRNNIVVGRYFVCDDHRYFDSTLKYTRKLDLSVDEHEVWKVMDQ